MAATIHASCVALERAAEPFGAPPDFGVLLLGASGAGKSDVVLRLLGRGAVLVSDDRTELFIENGLLYARAARSLAGLLEVRGLGIVELQHREGARIGMAVLLVPPLEVLRLPMPERYEPPAEVRLCAAARPPLFRLAASEASASAKIAAAAAAIAQNRLKSI